MRTIIDAKNISHAWVAGEIGMTPATLSNILNSKTADPSFFTVYAIARLIEEPLSAFVDDSPLTWLDSEHARLRETAEWIIEKTSRAEGHGWEPLEIPKRRKRKTRPIVRPAAATPDAEVTIDAIRLRRHTIPKDYRQRGVDMVFSVVGDSMTGADIHPGDLLYVASTTDIAAAVGKNIVCMVDNDTLIKRLTTRGRKLVLNSANRKHPKKVIDEDSERFTLIGIVIAHVSES
jgi:SOS-response transcriptional repressor LexA